jgi:hypothetical protein
MEGDIANQLAGLEAYTAKVRILRGGKRVEHLIQTIQPDPPPFPGFRPQTVGMLRSEVEEVIRQRTRQTALPTGNPPTQPLDRFEEDMPPLPWQ